MKLEELNNYNIKAFKKDFILAGPVTNIKRLVEVFKKCGVPIRHEKPIYKDSVILCTCRRNLIHVQRGEVKIGTLTDLQILNRSWWDYYHNPKKIRRPKLKTYNIPAHQNYVISNLLELEEIPLLIPESE